MIYFVFVSRQFAGKTPYDLARGNPTLQALLQKFVPNSFTKDCEAMHSPTGQFAEINFGQKSVSVHASQPSVESNKSSDPGYDIPNRETSTDSPIRSTADKSGIYSLIWPEPKTILELGNTSPPFIAGKELFISIIQVEFV